MFVATLNEIAYAIYWIRPCQPSPLPNWSTYSPRHGPGFSLVTKDFPQSHILPHFNNNFRVQEYIYVHAHIHERENASNVSFHISRYLYILQYHPKSFPLFFNCQQYLQYFLGLVGLFGRVKKASRHSCLAFSTSLFISKSTWQSFHMWNV